MHVVASARRGWAVTGVDLIDKALDRARQRIADSGVQANVVRADVTALPADAVRTGFHFFLDLGCFHGLSQPQREAMARAVTARDDSDFEPRGDGVAEVVGSIRQRRPPDRA